MPPTTHETDRCKPVTRALLAAAVMSASNGVVIADARRKNMPLIFVNPAFERITGYPAEEVIGTNCRFLQGDEKKQGGLATLRNALSSGQSCSVVLRNYRKDGKPFWNELYVAPIWDDEGELTHFLGIQTDVTRRVEAENVQHRLQRELRERNRELEALNEQKNQLLGMAAHDIRNPLTSIGFSVAMLKPILGDPVSQDRGQQVLERIQEAAAFML